jgi:uncharacterized protein YggE
MPVKIFGMVLAILGLWWILQEKKVDDFSKVTVAGYYEQEVEANEAILSLMVSEYYAESLDPRVRPENYRTRAVLLSELEVAALQALRNAGVSEDMILATENGMHYHEAGKDGLSYKTYRITLKNLSMVDSVLASLSGPSIKNFSLVQLKNSQMDELRLAATNAALNNAKVKAAAMIKGHAKLGKLVTVREAGVSNPVFYKREHAMLMAADETPATPNYEKVKITANVEATFLLK